MKRITILSLMLFGLLTSMTTMAQGKKPVAAFSFKEGTAGWQVISMSDEEQIGWKWREGGYGAVPAGTMWSQPSAGKVRHAWLISPPLDLSDVTDSEFYLHYSQVYASNTVSVDAFFQEDANLDLTITDKDAFLAQWGDVHTNLNYKQNGGALGVDFSDISSWRNAYASVTNPQNLSMHDGKKIRMGIRVVNGTESSAITNTYIHEVTIAGNIIDEDAPVPDVTAVDSVGNTFARAWFEANEISKMYWAVKAQGESVASLSDIKDNLGSDVFVSSGTFDYNVPGSNVPFEIGDLEINTNYTLFYGAEDFSNNMSAVKTLNFSSDNDLTAPVISSIELTDISEVAATANISADEAGEIMLRIYESGWEPSNTEQFEGGQGAVVRVEAYKVKDFTAAADTIVRYLEPAKSYIAYGTVTDLTGNVSEIFKSDRFTTLTDDKAPVITSSSITDITNHGANLNIVCDEPTAGFGDVLLNWVATAQGTVLDADGVLNKTNGLASGVAVLDSATYDNVIVLDNLEKNTAYTIHCVAVDESENKSEVTAIDITTTDAMEEVPLFLQEFDVTNLNYHFVDVTIPEGSADSWKSNAGNSMVSVGNSVKPQQYDSWCVVGPVNLENILDIKAEWEGKKTWGEYADKLSLWVSSAYTGDGVIDINNWTQISQPGDFANTTGVQSAKRDVPVEFAKAKVYFAIRYNHTDWAHNWNIHWLKIYGSRVGDAPTPVVEWVETYNPTSTSATMLFNASTYGRVFWYLAEEDGSVPAAPTVDQVKSGSEASMSGILEYRAGNSIDQEFTLNNLKPGTKYHLYTAFRDAEYNWADGLTYFDPECIFETKSLEITSVKDSLVLATGSYLKMAAMSEGRLFWTVKEKGVAAPQNFDEIYSSFDKKGAFDYNATDESELSWYINSLDPETEYTAYMIMTEGSREYYSAIQSFDFTTSSIAVTTASHEQAMLMPGETDKYTVNFTAKTSSNGWIHLVMTEKGAVQPAIEDILDVSAGFAGKKFALTDPNDIVVQIDELSQANSSDFTAWIVVTSGDHVSPVYQLDSGTTTAIIPNVDESLIEIRGFRESVKLIYRGEEKTEVEIYNILGQLDRVVTVYPGENDINGLDKGINILSVKVNGGRVTKKVVIQ